MAKPTGSATAKTKAYYAAQRETFRKQAEQAENGSSYRSQLVARQARAAESLVGTDRARELVNDTYFKSLKADIGLTQEPITIGTLSLLEKLLDNETLNRPLGSGVSYNEWQGIKDAVQAEFSMLAEKGYTTDEVAAALAYEDKLVRGRKSASSSGSKLPRGAKAVTITVDGRKTTYYEQNGMLMKSDAVGATRGTPVKTAVSTTLAEIYANAKENGIQVTTHSAKDVKKANAAYDERRKANKREIASAEVKGSREGKKLSKQSGRVRTSRTRSV